MASFDFQTTFIPLALLVSLGWVLGRTQDIDLKSVSSLLIFAITPVVAFGSTAQMHFQGVYIFLPFIVCLLSSLNGLTSFALGRSLLKKKDLAYLLPVVTGSGNNGYLGLPLAMAVFAPEHIGVYFLMMPASPSLNPRSAIISSCAAA